MRPPSVDTLARQLIATDLIATDLQVGELPLAALPQSLYVQAARAGIARAVKQATATSATTPPSATEVIQAPTQAETAALCLKLALLEVRSIRQRLLQPVINATGTLLHTNLGRAPRSSSAPRLALDERSPAPVRYSSLEFDLETGQRGSRRNHASSQLALLSGAESALVVNNCAAALMLVVAALASGRGVAVSRSELVEIGGAFRIPDVLSANGACLVEVGTTNRTRLSDFERVLDRQSHDVAMLLAVHRSNYRISGFTEDASVAELGRLARSRQVPFVVDTGSGLLDSRLPWLADPSGVVPSLPWLAAEPGSRQTLEAGADLVVFSADKLLGGPQAGVIAGRADLVERCARHPLARALRPGGTVLADLQDVCLTYLDKRAKDLPFWKMACLTVDELKHRATQIAESVAESVPGVAAIPCMSVPGGGTLPDATIDSYGVFIAGDAPKLMRSFRFETPAVIGRTADHHGTSGVLFDLRTVDPLDDTILAARLSASVTGAPRSRG
jgi:L-seryl-tRNA(Ser) seleniumtransferase